MDNAYYYSPQYVQPEPHFIEQPIYGDHRYAEEPRVRYVIEEPVFSPEARFVEPSRFEEARARYIEVPQYSHERYEPEVRYVEVPRAEGVGMPIYHAPVPGSVPVHPQAPVAPVHP